MVPTEYQRRTGKSTNVSLLRLSKLSAYSRFDGSLRFLIYCVISLSYSWLFWSNC
jgi:hypothetical protein